VQLSIFFPFFLLQIHCNFSQVLSRLLFFLLHSELRFRVVIYVYIDTTREKWVFAKASDLGFRFFMEVPSSEVTFSEYICTCTLSMIIRSYIYHLLTFSAEHKLFQ
jgi:predicted lipid carrier protein YhbT